MKENGRSSEKSFTSANEADNSTSPSTSKQLIDTTFLENTPFAIVRVDNKYFVGCGHYRLTDYMDTKDEAEEYARRITWNNITAVIAVIVQAEIQEALKLKTTPLPTIALDEQENQ